MLKALLRKDYLLLRLYLRIALVTSVVMYPIGFALVYWFTESYLDESRKQFASQALTTFAGGSVYGLVLTCLFAALIAASTIASERSDRSNEFLACLPPSRRQNLISKMTLLLASVGGMIILHNFATFAAWNLTGYARASELDISFARNLSMTCVILCITGFSFAGSSLMKSNGAPALFGLMSPLLSLCIELAIGKQMDISYEGNVFAFRYSAICATLGIVTLSCGCLWYLNTSES